jgi:hypothetical protein
MPRTVLATLLVGAATTASAGDPVPVRGSAVKYPDAVSVTVGGKPVALKLTGVGLRTKASLFNVYAVGSYLQDGVRVGNADELARVEAARMLYLVMERTVDGADLIDAFKSAINSNYPADKFAAEFASLSAAVGNRPAAKGDHISMVYAPGVGLRVQIVGKMDVTIDSPAFARAVWEIYLGPKPIQDDIKAGLVKLLGR